MQSAKKHNASFATIAVPPEGGGAPLRDRAEEGMTGADRALSRAWDGLF
jgi:hypothetical protein